MTYLFSKSKQLSDLLLEQVDLLLEMFDIKYRDCGRYIQALCPLHDGDNETAFNIYLDSGKWACHTKQCHEVFGCNLLCLVRALLSKKQLHWQTKGDPIVNINTAMKWTTKFLKMKEEDIDAQLQELYKNKFDNSITAFYSNQTKQDETSFIPRDKVRANLKIPSPYYLDRDYTPEILDKYDVGDCHEKKKQMYKRAVVPVYDEEHKYMIGCTGRTIIDDKRKWIHSYGFTTNCYLYNLWFAREHIKKSHVAILVESPGNVWRLEENGIHNSLGLFGCQLSIEQENILSTLGILSIIILMDNDENQTGQKACQKLIHRLKSLYRVYAPTISKNDIGEMCSDEITQDIKPTIDHVTEVIKEYQLCNI